MNYKKCQFCGEIKEDVKIRKWLRVKVEEERLPKEDNAMKPILACDRCWEENQKSKK